MEARDFLQALRTEGLSLTNPNKVVLTKDNMSHKQRLYQHIQTLFQIQGLSPDALDTLRNIVLMPKKGIFENCIVYDMDVPYYNALLNTIESIYHKIKLDDSQSAACSWILRWHIWQNTGVWKPLKSS